MGILLALALAGCGEDAEQPPSGAHRLEDEVALGTSSHTWLVVVDNSSTSAADELRRLYAQEFVTYWADATRLCADDAAAWVDDWTGGAGAEVAFEVSGSAAGIGTAIGCLGARGRATVVGIHATPPPVDLFRVFWRELTLIGARVYERADFEEAVRLLAAGAIPSETLITDVMPLDAVGEAFRAMDAGESMKILINCGG